MKKVMMGIVLLMMTILISKPVQIDTARNIALNWYKGFSASKTIPNISSVDEIRSNDNVDIYVFNMTEGFVLVAGDDASVPVLGYSFDKTFVYSEEKSNIKFWIDAYRTSLKEIRYNELSNETTLEKWNNILSNEIVSKDSKAVAPLLSTTWNQSPIYNDYCPLDGGSLSVVGCVATAMSQIMKYHSYPLHGNGEHSYNELGQDLYVNYFFSTYNWDEMPNSLSSSSTPVQKHEVAQISYHAGVSVEMMYGADGSGAYSTDVPYALKTYFKYNAGVGYYDRSSFNSVQWHTLILENLDNALPVYYSGQGPDGGHAFVCDGYQATDYFHFNWGWGGSSDGYYYLDNLNPGGLTFNDWQAVVKDIRPGTVDLVVDPFIEDFVSSENEIVINLNDYFTSISGGTIDYSIDDSSNIVGLTHSITDSILTLTKVGNGLSKIVVVGTNKSDGIFDDFYVRFGDPLPLAGFGNTYNLNAFSTINAGNNSELNAMEKLSVSMWIKLNQTGINQGVISKASSTSSGWYIQVQSNNIIKFFIKTQDGLLRKLYSLNALNADEWYHLAVVYDGKDFVMYLNGEYENQKVSYPTASAIQHDESDDLILGSAPGMYFDGSIDEVCVWDQPKSLDFFRSILQNQPSTSDPDLVSYWNIDEGFYSEISDQNNLNNALIENINLEYWTNSTAPVRYFIPTNTNATGTLPGEKGAELTYAIVDNGSLGTMSILDPVAGTFEYTPDTDVFGVDTLTYKVSKDIYS
ncbi:MAG: C10 family peptidase [Candidatus Delongbacteria bacterium]|nr:C10 family peptidase [Candidatus Delongbacteria bacterium]